MANNAIALLAKVPEFDTPAETETKALQLEALRDAAAQRRQATADDTAVRDVYRNNSDPAGRIKALYGVNPKAAMAAEKSMVDMDKDRAEIGRTNSTAKATDLETERKKIKTVGEVLGYVMNNPSVDTATRAVATLEQHGMLTAEEAAGYRAEIAKNPTPEQIKEMAAESYTAALDADKQLSKIETRDLGGAVQTTRTDPVSGKQTLVNTTTKTQTPDSVASNARMATEGRLNRANQLAVQGLITERQSAKGVGVEPSFSPETINRLAAQVLRGDRTGLANIGRGAQGAANLVAVQNAVTAEGERRGLSPDDITAASATLEGLRTGMRATGNISARIENAAQEAAELAPLALEASRAVSRSGLLPFGKAQIMFNTQTNDPDLARFATANMGLATAYASAMARGNKPTVSDNEHARELLSTAQDQPSYEAKVNQMMAEIKAAQRAPKVVREHLSDEISRRDKKVPPTTNAQGWTLHTDAQGNKAYVSPDGKQFQEVK